MTRFKYYATFLLRSFFGLGTNVNSPGKVFEKLINFLFRVRDTISPDPFLLIHSIPLTIFVSCYTNLKKIIL